MSINNPSKTDVQSTQKRGIRSSIRTKITLWAGFCLVLLSLILIGYSVVTLRQATINNATNEVLAITEAKAGLVQNQLDQPLFIARSMAQSLSAIKDTAIPVSLSRDQVNAMLRRTLIENPSFLGTYTLWEPNEFDGNDAQYVRATAHDNTGRFIPYWVRGDEGIIHTEALVQYEVPGPGDWYIKPRSTKQEVMIAPIFRRIQGKEVVIASFIVPIVQNDNFYGIAGVDAPIGFVQQLVDDIDLYDGTANAVLFTDTGKLIAVRQQPEYTSLSVDLIYKDFDAIQSRLDTSFTRLSPDGKYLQIFSPIDVSGGEKHWVLGLIIPFDKITAPATTAAVRQVTISAGLIVLALLLLWFLAGQVVRPMLVLTNAATAVSQGDWAVRAAVHSNDEAEVLADAFNAMTSQLQTVFGTLEQRVADRTRALSSVAEISTAASTILETDKLLQQVVDLAKERFDFYHAHIYLLDETGTSLVLSSGAGAIGRQMVVEGRSIPLDREQSLVARAAREKKGVTVNDVTTEPDFLPNPLLPDTRSELAVPLMVGDEVLGVFDVQSEVAGRFTDSDIAIQTTLASQVASAVQNARSYTKIQRSQDLLSEALSISRLANWEYDVDKDLFTFNDNFYSIFRTSVEKVGGYKLSSADYARNFVHPEDAALVGTEIQRVLASKERHFKTDLEHRIIFDDGEIGYISVKINVERDENGRILRWYGANQDVTERRRLEEINRKHAIQQEAINKITQKIQSTTTIEAALQIAARELGHALGMKSTLVALEPEAVHGSAQARINSQSPSKESETMGTGVS